MYGGENYDSILDNGFVVFYMEGLNTTGRKMPSINFSRTDLYWLNYYEKRNTLFIEDYIGMFKLFDKIRDVFKNTDNIQEILCPDLVKIIMTEDFYKRLGKSLDENKKIRPEILFDGYRKDTEVKDNKENTAQSDGDLDL